MAKTTDKINGAVRFAGVTYRPGDEEKFAGAKVPKADLQRLADKGAIAGFGTSADAAADPDADDDSKGGKSGGKAKKDK